MLSSRLCGTLPQDHPTRHSDLAFLFPIKSERRSIMFQAPCLPLVVFGRCRAPSFWAESPTIIAFQLAGSLTVISSIINLPHWDLATFQQAREDKTSLLHFRTRRSRQHFSECLRSSAIQPLSRLTTTIQTSWRYSQRT